MRRAATAVLLALSAAALSCAKTPSTEVLVIVDATDSVRGRADSLQVEISGGASADASFGSSHTERFGPPASDVGFPRHFGLVPKNDDPTRVFQVIAIARAGTTVVSATVVRSTYAAHMLIPLRIVLDDLPCARACTPAETCREGQCVPIFIAPGDGGMDAATDMPLHDGGPDAGDGGFDSGDAGCHVDSDCSDHDPCDGVETCVSGSCVPGAPLVCDDRVACTDDTCVPGAGCRFMALDSKCIAAAMGVCDLTLGCQYPMCNATTCAPDPATCETASCGAAGCMRGSSCTSAQMCCGGACVPAGCDDGNPCTDDACPGSICIHTPNTHVCDDGDPCTINDVCGGGVVAMANGCGGVAINCDDGQVCTTDVCSGGTCFHMPNFEPCGGSPDFCMAGLCSGGACMFTYCAMDEHCCSGVCEPLAVICGA